MKLFLDGVISGPFVTAEALCIAIIQRLLSPKYGPVERV